MINVNNFRMKTDIETIENAMANKQADGIVVIPPRVSDVEPERDYWLIDRAVLLDSNTTVIMQNSTIKLSDKCRDNFFRTANCGMGIEFPEKINNVHIKGEGMCTLIGVDHPRATGDSGKMLAKLCPYDAEEFYKVAPSVPKERRSVEKMNFWDGYPHSYGTDADTGESQFGDWRNIGILFANTEEFSIRNLHIIESHGWGISLEECSYGYVEKISFNSCGMRMIDGVRSDIRNQDGIDIRNGCHDITISDIRGITGDDVIALTAIAEEEYHAGGALQSTHVMGNDWSTRDRNIHDIIIKNVAAYSEKHQTIRLLPVMAKIHNILIDGVVENTPDGKTHHATVLLGGTDAYGTILPESMNEIIISNVVCACDNGIIVGSELYNSVIANVVNKRKNTPLIVGDSSNFINVKTEDLA